MFRRSSWLLAAGGLWLLGCQGDPLPPAAEGPPGPSDPTLPTPWVRTLTPPSEAETCTITMPSADSPLEQSAALTEATTRRVAASAGSLFVFDGARLQRSADEGESFTELATPVSYVRSVAASESEVFLSGYQSGAGNGVWRSLDEGATWTKAAGLDDVIVNSLRADGGIVIAETRVWSSATESFEQLAVPEGLFLDRLASDGKTYLGSTYGGVFRSEDGSAWTHVTSLTDIFYPKLVIDGQLAFAIDSQGALARSLDAGATFELVNVGADFGTALDVLLIDGALVVATTDGLFRSLDAGATLTKTASASNATIDVFFDFAQFLAGHGSALFAGGATLRVSDDVAASWHEAPPIIDATPWALGQTEDYVFASTRDMKLHASLDGATWSDVASEGHAMAGLASAGSTSVMLLVEAVGEAYFPDGVLAISHDGGQSFQALDRPDDNFMTSFSLLERVGDTLFLGASSTVTSGSEAPGLADGTGLFRSLDDGKTWLGASDGFPVTGYDDYGTELHDRLLAVHGALGSKPIVFASLANASVYRSTDAGATWVPASDGLPSGELGASVAIDVFASTASDVLAASTTQSEVLARWSPSKAAWEPAPADGLPEGFAIHALLAHGGIVFAGVAAADHGSGLYASTDGGASFVRIGESGLDGVPVELSVRDETLFIGVDHGGLWTLDLGPCQAASAP